MINLPIAIECRDAESNLHNFNLGIVEARGLVGVILKKLASRGDPVAVLALEAILAVATESPHDES